MSVSHSVQSHLGTFRGATAADFQDKSAKTMSGLVSGSTRDFQSNSLNVTWPPVTTWT